MGTRELPARTRTHCTNAQTHTRTQMGGCAMTATGEPVAAAIDGTDGSHMRLPLPPLNATSLPEPYSPGEVPELDRLEAAAKMVRSAVQCVPIAHRRSTLRDACVRACVRECAPSHCLP
jgi:hypothetical protein